jgi:Trk-type K+ transport system membrane component
VLPLEIIYNKEFRSLVLTVIFILILGAIFYNQVEGWSYLDALYFCASTLTTVGYGDFAPQTDLGKAFTILYIIIGVGMMLGFVNVVGRHVLTKSK